MTIRHFVLATAGHVDHGKSALIKSLTGTDPDRLPEEKARGITIDLGFAHLDLTSAQGGRIMAGIVDVPGHEDFVRNMIAGVGSIDLALLVVAADDGWMPQTEEHLQILMYLGVKRLVVAITKSDLGGVEKVREQVRQELRATPFARCSIVPTSVNLTSGIAELREAIAAELANISPPPNPERPRLCLDRAFTLQGVGTVVTGTLTGGSLRAGQSVLVQPGNLTTRIRSIQTYGREVETAHAGARTALNLPDIDLGKSAHTVGRGDILTTLAADSSSTLDVLLEVSPRHLAHNTRTRPLRNFSVVDVHHGTSRTPARIFLVETESVEPGAKALAQLRLSVPLFAFLGDRFVIRDRSQQHTIAGGIVLNPDGSRSSLGEAAERAFLQARATGWDDVDVCVHSEIARRQFVDPSALLRKSRFTAAEIGRSLDRLRTQGRVAVFGKIVAAPAGWKERRERAIEMIDNNHATHPERPGLDLNIFRTAFRGLAPEVIEELLNDLCRTGFIRMGQSIARQTHETVLPAHLEPVAAKILQALAAKPFDPPARKLIAPDGTGKQALRFLIDQGRIVDVSPEIVLRAEDFELMKNTIVRFLSARGPATSSQIRQELQSSRRTIIPLLEYLDRQGVTRRIGDQRILRD